MKGNLETAWLRSTAGERQDFIELYSDDIRELLPMFDDRDSGDNELIAREQDNGDDEQLDPAELPAIIDTSIECSVSDDGDFAADQDEEVLAASRGVERRASGKRVTAAPSSKDDVERLTKEFLERGGQISKVRPGISGLQPPPNRVPAWRRKIVSSRGA